MTNQKILEIAMKQSAADLNCRAEEFLKNEPVVVSGGIGPGAKKYYQEPGFRLPWSHTEIILLLL